MPTTVTIMAATTPGVTITAGGIPGCTITGQNHWSRKRRIRDSRFKTRCEIAGMKPINIEKLMNHSTGISDSYYRPTEQELLEDYLKAVDTLSIDNDKLSLQKQVEVLNEKSKEENYIIKGKLSEKDEEIRPMKEELSSMRSEMNDVLEVLKIAKSKNGKVGKVSIIPI
jgi:hypothetical protein